MVNILLFVILEFWLTDDTCTVQEINVFNQHSNAHRDLIRGMIKYIQGMGSVWADTD